MYKYFEVTLLQILIIWFKILLREFTTSLPQVLILFQSHLHLALRVE